MSKTKTEFITLFFGMALAYSAVGILLILEIGDARMFLGFAGVCYLIMLGAELMIK